MLIYGVLGYLFTGLSVFSWICWIVPNNIPVNQIFGAANGMGLFPVTFDWSQISWISNPMMSPWWAGAQIFTGFVILYGIILPCLYYTNVSILRLAVLYLRTDICFRHGTWHTSRCTRTRRTTALETRTMSLVS